MSSATPRVPSWVPTELFIGGDWRSASDEATFAVVNPADGAALTAVADATVTDGRAALDAAAAAQPEFAAQPPLQRHEILTRAFELLHERIEDLALLMTLEMGKPLAESRAEISYAAEFFRHAAGQALTISGGYQVAPQGGARFLVAQQPVGPCLLITPWNFPMAMATRKLGPAIAAGCTSVIKPASQTPLSVLALTQLLQQAGLPDGVVNVLTTTDSSGVMEPLIRSGVARKLSFTGSTEVGKMLLEHSAERVLLTSMELGGNAPFLVFDDADLDAAVAGAVQAKMRNMGEACTAANRFYVQAGVFTEFADRLTAELSAMIVGPGTEDGVQVGPLIDAAARDKVAGLVADAVAQGATLRTGGEVPDGDGYFYPPTVLTDVPAGAELASTEIFGPVAPLTRFETESEAISAANDTAYGLVSYLYTRDLDRALRVAEALQSGMVGINQGVVSNPGAPFGGIKESGLGREGGTVGIEEYLETKYIGITVAD